MPGHAAPIAVILLLQLRVRESAGDVTVVCRDLRDVEVTWDPERHAGANLSLTWRYGGDPRRPCPRYFLSDGVTSGCVLPARRGPRPLEIDVRRGAEPVFHRKGLASAFLKPRPPDNLTLHWLEDAVRVTCPALPHVGLDYVIQHRGPGDADWVASAPAPSCDVTVGGADPRACLSFRARASPREPIYGRDARPSDWSRVTQRPAHPGVPETPRGLRPPDPGDITAAAAGAAEAAQGQARAPALRPRPQGRFPGAVRAARRELPGLDRPGRDSTPEARGFRTRRPGRGRPRPGASWEGGGARPGRGLSRASPPGTEGRAPGDGGRGYLRDGRRLIYDPVTPASMMR